MDNKYCMISTATNSKDCCDKIIKSLLEEKLVSCVQVNKVNSTYVWKGNIENADEFILRMKSKRLLYKEIEKCILENHNYETPQIIMTPIEDGYLNFLDWIEEVTK